MAVPSQRAVVRGRACRCPHAVPNKPTRSIEPLRQQRSQRDTPGSSAADLDQLVVRFGEGQKRSCSLTNHCTASTPVSMSVQSVRRQGHSTTQIACCLESHRTTSSSVILPHHWKSHHSVQSVLTRRSSISQARSSRGSRCSTRVRILLNAISRGGKSGAGMGGSGPRRSRSLGPPRPCSSMRGVQRCDLRELHT